MGTEGPLRSRDVALTTHPYLVTRSRLSMSYTTSPPLRLHGVAGQLFLTILLTRYCYELTFKFMSRIVQASVANKYGLDCPGLIYPIWKRFIYSYVVWADPAPSLSPIEWVLEALFSELKRPEREAGHSIHLSPLLRMCAAIPLLS
jgi:hypothetical protein